MLGICHWRSISRRDIISRILGSSAGRHHVCAVQCSAALEYFYAFLGCTNALCHKPDTSKNDCIHLLVPPQYGEQWTEEAIYACTSLVEVCTLGRRHKKALLMKCTSALYRKDLLYIWCSALIRAGHNLSKSGWLKVFEAVELNHNVQAHADLWHAE